MLEFIILIIKNTILNISFLTFATLVILWNQLKLANKSYTVNIDLNKSQNAVNLARYYSEEIIPNVGYINNVFCSHEISKLLSGFPYCAMSEFTSDEMNSLFDEDKLKLYDDLCKKLNFDILFRISIKYENLPLDLKSKYALLINIKYENELKKKIDLIKSNPEKFAKNELVNLINEIKLKNEIKKDLMDEYETIRIKTLNNLEYFAMNFIQDLADEEVVYQSLHQTYLSVVQMLYIEISRHNTSGHMKYYNNVIELYKLWSGRKNDKVIQEKDACKSTVTSKKPIKK